MKERFTKLWNNTLYPAIEPSVKRITRWGRENPGMFFLAKLVGIIIIGGLIVFISASALTLAGASCVRPTPEPPDPDPDPVPIVALPAAPSNLAATVVSSTRVDLVWQDNSDNEDGFRIRRKDGASGAYTQIAVTGPDVTVYSDTSLSAGTVYYYQVRAYNGDGSSSYSNEVSVTTPGPVDPDPVDPDPVDPDPTPPEVPDDAHWVSPVVEVRHEDS